MSWEYFNNATREELLLDLKREYFASLEGSFKKTMEIGEAEKYLRDYVSSDNLTKVEKLADAIETVLWTLIRNRRRIVELETLTRDFQVGSVRKHNVGKKVE